MRREAARYNWRLLELLGDPHDRDDVANGDIKVP